MSFVNAVPGALGTASADLAAVGSQIGAANAIASAPTTLVTAAAHDQVSAAVAALFSNHARGYQTIGARLAAVHQQFVSALHAGASSYALAEAANASPMQQLLNLADTPNPGAGGHPLIVDAGTPSHCSPGPSPGAAVAAALAAGRNTGVGGGGRLTGGGGTHPAGDGPRLFGAPGMLLTRGGVSGFGVGGTARYGRNPASRLTDGVGDWPNGPGRNGVGNHTGWGSAGLLGDGSSVVKVGFWDTGRMETDGSGGPGAPLSGGVAFHTPEAKATGGTLGSWYPRQRWIAWRERERRDAVARPSRRRRPQRILNTLHGKGYGITRALSQTSAPGIRPLTNRLHLGEDQAPGPAAR